MEIGSRLETAEDEPFVHRLLLESMTGELAAWAWPEAIRASLLETQYRGKLAGIEATYPHADRRILLADGDPAGRIVVHRDDREIHVVDVVVSPELRNRGVATYALRRLIEEAERTAKPVTLTVNAFNPAQRLYLRLGFRRVGGDDLQWRMERAAASEVR
jgi:ribosomal protein S18 acetylase RimI-like enzyme